MSELVSQVGSSSSSGSRLGRRSFSLERTSSRCSARFVSLSPRSTSYPFRPSRYLLKLSSFFQMPVSGLFTLETSQVRISRVAFHYSWLPSKPSLTTAPADSFTPSLPVLRMPKDRNALNAKVLLPLERTSSRFPRPLFFCFVDLTCSILSLPLSSPRLSTSYPDGDHDGKEYR